MKTSDIGKQVWKDRFVKAYNMKWKSLGKSQKMFAEEINKVRTRGENGTIGTVSSQQVSKWLHGTLPEFYNLDAICEVLELDIDYFSPTHEEEYRDSSQYITKVGKEHTVFSKEIGLDLDFLKGLHNVVDFDSLFPMYSPIVSDNTDIMPVYKRLSNYADSALIDDELDFLQVHKDGQTLTLHRCDLAYLREVQDKVSEYVEFLFSKRLKEMETEVEEVNRRTHFKLKDGGDGYRPLRHEERLKVDRFAKYAYGDTPKKGGQDNGKH